MLIVNGMSNNKNNQKGYIALISVIIAFAVALMIVISAGLLGVSELKMELQKSQSLQSYYLANLCAEHSLMRLKENMSYNGDELINLAEGTCRILPIEGKWTLKVSASSSGQVKKMKIIVSQIRPKISIDSWQEVAEF
jgi:Tfp pilus assembly protein PilV